MDLSKLTDDDLAQINVIISELRGAYDRLIRGNMTLQEYTGEEFHEGFEGLALYGKNMMDFEEKILDFYNKRQEIKTEVERFLRTSKIKAMEKQNSEKPKKVDRRKEKED